ncbi:hypothetical protein [Celeribacter halophilus]|uniref:EF-hand domain-containing protein n=1 Tax=Celeribacter halophilus TaxID=576117 RepID=A0A1I3RQK7_9RHOB|nr:hypothetical protein [Celeribacter halophilus]PZX12676.1 hypothetical protein LX82_01419 [Celeribacter halophilus]SFJ47486.1 hypothetical protein SAMN04488138_105181 [Celeribacter halophilus]
MGNDEKAIKPPLREVASITRITQEDFLAQLAQALALYDRDEDGLLTEEEWQWVQDALNDTGA